MARDRIWWNYIQRIIAVHPTIPNPQTDLTRRERAAVEDAIKLTKRRPDGAQRLELVRMVFWENRTVEEAAAALGVTWETARHWTGDFTWTTAYAFFGDGIIPHQQEEEPRRRGRRPPPPP